MEKEVYELHVEQCPSVQISVVRLNMLSVVQQILSRIPAYNTAEFLAACYRMEPEGLPDSAQELRDHILIVEGDMAGLEIRNRWGGDDPTLVEPFLKSLAAASTEFYETVEGELRLQKIQGILKELMFNPES